MKTILLQGDSITDAGRDRQNDQKPNWGYASLVTAEIICDYPGQYQVYNRGVSGDRIVDVYARMKRDIINLKPDYLSILIGVNDVWHEFHESPNGVDDEKFRRVYCMLIEELKAALPELKIYILEPFCLKGTATEAHWDAFDQEVRLRAVSARAVAEKYGLPFIPLQQKLDDLCAYYPADHWLGDGVHPTAAGHEVLKQELMDVLKKDLA
ncbi:MAG: SGNH/GDSL hydrolase family protein [Clostridia bacterium]|nr:SGNH/GDSL hydrolase family protein [Clostridia bacterium]